MPVYEYECETCGCFDDVRTVAERDTPATCPECEGLAARVLFSAPRFSTVSSAVRQAHATNERSAHQPRSTRDADAGTSASARRHGNGCACCVPRRSGKQQNADTSKSFPSRRPWMISH